MINKQLTISKGTTVQHQKLTKRSFGEAIQDELVNVVTAICLSCQLQLTEQAKSDSLRSQNLQPEQTKISVKPLDPTKPSETSRKSRKSNSFRNAIKKTISQTTLHKEDENVPAATSSTDNHDTGSIQTDYQRGKPTKHQGNAKTFKRKSKRPGRV